MSEEYPPDSIRVLAGLDGARRRPGGFIAYEEGGSLDLLFAAHAAGWPDPAAAVELAERVLGGEPWPDSSTAQRIEACQISCEAGMARAGRGEGTGTPLAVEALAWLEEALDGLTDRLRG